MPYRDDLAAATLRRDTIARELADVQRRLDEQRGLEARARELTSDLDRARQVVDQARARVRLPLLDKARIASPCHARWDDMAGDHRVRHCGSCDKDVFDLSEMTAADAEALLRERTGGLCVRLYRRADGTVITADCPEGARLRRRRRVGIAAAAALAGSLAAGAAVRLMSHDDRTEMREPVAVMGGIGEPIVDPGIDPTVDPGVEMMMGDVAVPDDLAIAEPDGTATDGIDGVEPAP